MADSRTELYASQLSQLIQKETVSGETRADRAKFIEFQGLLRDMFPHIFRKCEVEYFEGSF